MEKNQSPHQLAKECLYTSLAMLMENKPYQEITITDITRKAGVSRMAYYRNYHSKDEILLERCREMFLGFLEIAARRDIQKEAFFTGFFEHIRENHQILELTIKAELERQVIEGFSCSFAIIFQQSFHWDLENEAVSRDFAFMTGGVCSLLHQWDEEKFATDPRELGRTASEMMAYMERRRNSL